MTENKKKMTEAEKQNVIDQLWLHYFNQTLYDKGMISEHDFMRMKTHINCRKPKAIER